MMDREIALDQLRREAQMRLRDPTPACVNAAEYFFDTGLYGQDKEATELINTLARTYPVSGIAHRSENIRYRAWRDRVADAQCFWF